jgi:GT2 family glycosyltransferase
VVIPAYASERYIRQALDSVFAQTYPRYEVIVINDGSPDTEQLETGIAEYEGRVVYLKQPNRGPSAARNAGILRAKGEFVAFLDSDDAWLPTYLERQVQALRRDPGYDFVYSDAFLWREDQPTRQTFIQEFPSRPPLTFDSLLSVGFFVVTSGTVMRREVLVNAGLFNERFLGCEDLDLWLRIAFRGAHITFQPEVLACHRLRKGSLSSSGSAVSGLEAQKRVYESVIDTLPLNDAQLAVAEKMLCRWSARIALLQGKQSLIEGDYANARSRLQSANVHFRGPKIYAMLALLNIAPSSARWLYAAYLRQMSPGHKKGGSLASRFAFVRASQ